MAKRRRPPPEITQRWTDILRPIAQQLAQQRQQVDQTRKELGAAIRGAFNDGVLVGPLKQATGLSGSRIYQMKFQLDEDHTQDS